MDQATIHPDVLPAVPPPPPPAPAQPETGVFAQLADPSRLASNLPVYRKLHCIGRGAFGKAYLVEAVRGRKGKPSSPQQRVLKKLPLSDVSESQRESAFREAQLMRRISRDCPFITRFSEVLLCKGGTVLCLVMEFCSGGDLRNALRQQDGQRLPEAQVLDWASQVGLALHHCHLRGVLHRDVKPENCFFRSIGGDLLLGDFGISCSLDTQHFAKTCCGSPLYLSPEIVNQETYSYASDVWSLGVMLYEMAMLHPPFKGTNICQVAFKIVSATPEALDASIYSIELQQLVDRLLQKDAKERPSLDEALNEAPLHSAVTSSAARHSLPWPPNELPRPSSTSGFVQRLRGSRTAGVACNEDEYEDDFEAYDDEDEAYQDDFEEMSGSEASYEADFEEESNDEGEAQEPMRLSEQRLREHICEELGEDALAIAESLGGVPPSLLSFLEGVLSAA